MGISFDLLERLRASRLLDKGSKILDIGSSNLYNAPAERVRDFIGSYRLTKLQSESAAFVRRIAKGSHYDVDRGGLNETFVGELLEYCGVRYLSLDIANGYKTELFDLNRDRLPKTHHGAFDAVLNIGTTEHVLNQYNSMEVIHNAVRVGGFIVHQLPVSGFTDHAYFVYTGRMFFDLAGYNRYEIVDVWYEGPTGEDDLYTSPRAYKVYFPKLREVSQAGPIRIPNCSLTIILRKTRDSPFLACLETSTSVGDIPASLRRWYDTEG